ncbi:multidrug effflux MFS transporter [Histidinibacterium aquaticum]|uniref:Bcr/CflA family efflux transporter n=1 Tax=Histidinibacterium aquaticum TaxID=2613962 RepID=A0A5J5GBU3_9RHOB|nr:multidrug effflux MFS transporter [Histidinibacterium aquaticum]KAA9005629.1 multidrug effflux MFS transporter [Histidinibacterium aquaticum]
MSDAVRDQGTGELRLLLTLGVLLAFASISTDLFLPALPAMAEALGAAEGELELVVSTYLLGFGAGQLLWGPVSDRFGRRGPIMAGLAVFALGSAGCALATEPWHVISWRVVQALGASAGVALARAMVRDLYDRDRAARVLSTLMTVMAVAPLLGPLVGAQILALASWQAIFWTLVAIGLGTLAAVAGLSESLPPEDRSEDAIGRSFRTYAELLGNRALMAHAGAIGFFYVGVFAVVAGGPFAFVTYHGLSPSAYALVFASGVFGLMIANMVNARLVTRVGSDRMLRGGAAGAALAGLFFVVVAGTDLFGVAGLILASFLYNALNGLITANAIAGALAKVTRGAGSASAVVGAIQYGSGMIGAALVGALADGTPLPMGAVACLGGLGCLGLTLVASRTARRDDKG